MAVGNALQVSAVAAEVDMADPVLFTSQASNAKRAATGIDCQNRLQCSDCDYGFRLSDGVACATYGSCRAILITPNTL